MIHYRIRVIPNSIGGITNSVLLVLLMSILSCLQASIDRPSPFSTTTISVEIGSMSGIGDLTELWAAGHPTGLSVAMPFYLGGVEAGIQILPFQAQGNMAPDFQTQYIFMGWGMQKSLASILSVFGGMRLGIQRMTFAGATGYAQSESELGTEASLGLAIIILPNWTLRATLRRQRIHTHVPIIIDFRSISVSRQLPTPNWLRRFLE